jgi:hypothetical protein
MTLDDKIKQLMKLHPDLFPTEARFWSWLRGCLRRGIWERSPLKFKFKKSACSPPPQGYTGRAKSGAFCALTGEWEMASKLEVDHLVGHQSLLQESDIIPFLIHLLATEGELQLVKKEAHKTKSYADRMGISFDDAVIEKEVIAIMKKGAKAVDKWLRENGASGVTATNRRDKIREVLKK